MKTRKATLALAVTLLALAPIAATAASFDCRDAIAAVELLDCHDYRDFCIPRKK